MVQSMTGYGKAICEYQQKTIVIEIRSLNSKQMDINMRIAPQYRDKELEIRNILSQQLERGKVDCAIYIDNTTGNDNKSFAPVNMEAFDYYREILQSDAEQKGWNMDSQDWVSAIFRLPDVIKPAEATRMDEDEWAGIKQGLDQAISEFKAFRTQEGLALQHMFEEKLDGISKLLEQVEQYEPERILKIRQRLDDNLLLLSEQTQQTIDKNRLEQEMIFYLEKLDITEEKVRLSNHIRYFRETMAEGVSIGKKLGFIAQEMGREINTLGSKSNHSEMQIIVVKMKDILEQIKEQVLNVL